MTDIVANLADVRRRLADACIRAGRDMANVEVLAVTKTLPPERVRQAFTAGLSDFAENKAQEGRYKASALSDLPLRWRMIGHLQTNKVKDMLSFADEFHALDSLRVAAALDRRLQARGRVLDVFVQVNTSGEASKFGLLPEEVLTFAHALLPFTTLRVRGLMTLAVQSTDTTRVRRCFQILRGLRDRLLQDGDDGQDWTGLSMGMSGDFEIAVEEGATIIRIGQALFGPRARPHTDYWPEISV